MLAAQIQISDQDARTISSSAPGEKLGQLAGTSDGRFYRLSLAGATALSPGKLTVNEDADTDVVNKTVAATVAAGATSVVLNSAGAVTANFYVGGYLTVNDATGEGISYYVTGNTGLSAAGELTVYLKEPLAVGLTVSVSEVTLVSSPFANTVISATDQADMPVGVPNVSVTAANYYWSQVGGICSVLVDTGGFTKGQALTIGAATAGAVENLDAAGEPQIGVAVLAGTATEYQPAWLSIN